MTLDPFSRFGCKMVSRSLRLLLALLLCRLASGAKRGLRQRLAEAEADGVPPPPEAEADGVPPPPKARGGVRRRLGSLPDSNGDPRSLPFYRSLKRDWGSGILSSARVQEYSHGAREQGAVGLDRLADAGASGQQAGNLFRDLKRIFGWPSGCAPINWIKTADQERAVHAASSAMAARVREAYVQ